MRLFRLLFLAAISYQLLATFAALLHLLLRRRSHRRVEPDFFSGVSVLKPLRGMDPNTHEAFISQINQRYPRFEILFGARDENDPAALEVHRLQREYPDAPIRLIIGGESTRNGKVGVLMALAREARYPIWVINDSDIKVDPEYLSRVVPPLKDVSVGLVTCPYRADAHNLPAAWESLGIATDFMPSTLVAQLLGVRDFGLGSTLAFRGEDLERVGGFAAIADFLADDYQLAKRITTLGKRTVLSTYTVETSLADATWIGIWRHQLRWARTIRLTKGAGHVGLPITHAGLWALIAIACGAWLFAAILLAARIISALSVGWFVLRSRVVARYFWLAPLWDVYSFVIWLASYASRKVRWRDQHLLIDRGGRIQV